MPESFLPSLSLAAAVLLAGAAQAATAPKKTPALLEKGKAAFGINCASCHGDTGAGDGQAAATLEVKPRNFAKGKFKNGAKVTDIFGTLEKGVPGSQMVAFTHLAEEERWALAYWVLELKAGKGRAK